MRNSAEFQVFVELVKKKTNDEVQATSASEVSEESRCMLNGMKKMVIRDREIEANKVLFKGIKSQLIGGSRTWFSDQFPEADFELRDRIVTIHLDGKSSEEEIV